MPSISSTGVGSGLDVNTIVSSLMAVEQRPLTQLQTQAGTLQTRISAYGTLKSQIAALGDVATRLATPANWSTYRVDSGDASALSAVASTSAAAGTHSLEVTQLAQPQVLASGPRPNSAAVLGTGTLTIELGTTALGVFTPRAGSSPVSIPIGAGSSSLAGIRDAINAAAAGVTASVVTGADGARLVLRGADGAASSMRVTIADDDGDSSDGSGLSALAYDPAAPDGAGRNLSQTQAAQDALFKIDGVAVSSATNAPANALEGVTLTLKQVTTKPVAFTVAVETMAVRKNVNDFVNAYNGLSKLLAQQTQADPSGAARGPLNADSTASSLLVSLRGMLLGTVAGAGAPASLSAAGIEVQRDGTLLVNESKLAPLLAAPAKLANLFAQAQQGGDASSRGFGVRFKAWAQALGADSGPLASRIDGLKRNATTLQKRQSAEQDRLERTESRLRAQYQQLDTQMSGLNARLAQMKSALGLA
ncbi:flagellar filament capping protein FliD [Ramlibacter sp.]|uniref:flagellar filament capping protein FliD n=1 Tax=Ramlibacter sp. TaxID=1917967 RepID=UPI003D0BEFCE